VDDVGGTAGGVAVGLGLSGVARSASFCFGAGPGDCLDNVGRTVGDVVAGLG
jgi:hypothetical protein